jgi:hypothetical protein
MGSLDKTHTRSTTVSSMKAQQRLTRLEISVDGPSGSGKSIRTLDTTLANAPGQHLFLIDSDIGSVSLNADCHDFYAAAPTDDLHGSGGGCGRIDAKIGVDRAIAQRFPYRRLALTEYVAGVHFSEQAKRKGRDPEALQLRAERARKALLGWKKAAVTVAPAARVVVAA